jgi:hypothetical protein
MGSKDAGRIVKFLLLLNKIVVDHINTKYSHIIGLRYDEPLSPSLPPDQQVVVEPQPPGDKTS